MCCKGVIVILLLYQFISKAAQDEDIVQNAATDLSLKFSEFKNDVVGVNFLQELMNKVSFEQKSTAGEEIIDQFSKHLANGFKNRFEAVRNLKRTAEELFANNGFDSPTTKDECCKVDPNKLEYSQEFRTHVGQDMCYRISPDSAANPFIPVSQKLQDVMQQNLQLEPSLKWQYFGTEEGTHVIFPKKVNSHCDQYDPRYRPWYVETVTPIPKDVVIVFDKSGSMEGERLDISKEAAITVIGTLNPNDRVALVVFSTEAQTPPGDENESCYSNQMAYAIPGVKAFYKKYIGEIKAQGSTFYNKAFNKAFDMLKTVVSTTSRRKVILFLTDGVADEPPNTILKRLSELNAHQQNSVTILTYGLGKDINEKASVLLQQIANMTMYNGTAGDRNIGHYVAIEETKYLRYQLASYYNFFATEERLKTPIVSVPYTDFSGLGTVTSVCLPVYDPNTILKGAVCADLTIGDLTVDLESFNTGENSYVFIIDNNGRPLLHPNLPSPGQHYNADPIFLNIKVLEAEAKGSGVLEQMINGNSPVQKKQIQTKILTYRGNVSYDGADVKQITATYYWRTVIGTRFIVCLVQKVDEKTVTIQNKYTVTSFVYHKLHLQSRVKMCTYFGKDVTKDQSAVKLSPNAFTDTIHYIYKRETMDDVKRYKGIMEDWSGASGLANPFKTDVKSYVAITEQMDTFWLGRLKSTIFVVKDYFFGSSNGVFRMFPGQEMPQSYDHLKSTWYIKALAFKGTLVISGPTTSDFGQTSTYTASHTVLEGRNSFGDSVVGVIGADFDRVYLKVILEQTLPSCVNSKYRCFLFDSSGFILYHPLMNRTATKFQTHMADFEPDILNFLHNNKYLVQSACVDFAWKTSYHTWRVNIDTPLDFRKSYPNIFITPIQGTNIFICMKDVSAFKNTICDSCKLNIIGRCTRNFERKCHCPCFNTVNFHHCTNSFTETKYPACSMTKHGANRNSINPVSTEKCFQFQCQDFKDSWSCLLHTSCKWCSTNSDNKEIVECVAIADCNDVNDSVGGNGGSSLVATVVPIVLVIIILAVVMVIIIVIFRKKLRTALFRADNEPEYLDVAPNTRIQTSSGESASGLTQQTASSSDVTLSTLGHTNSGENIEDIPIQHPPSADLRQIDTGDNPGYNAHEETNMSTQTHQHPRLPSSARIYSEPLQEDPSMPAGVDQNSQLAIPQRSDELHNQDHIVAVDTAPHANIPHVNLQPINVGSNTDLSQLQPPSAHYHSFIAGSVAPNNQQGIQQ